MENLTTCDNVRSTFHYYLITYHYFAEEPQMIFSQIIDHILGYFLFDVDRM